MCLLIDWLKASRHLVRTAHRVLLDSLRLVVSACRSRSAIEAENLFLRKQLALYQERKTKPHRADDSTRWLMSFLSQWFDWRNALVVVKPETLIRWHRKGFRLFWRWKSRSVGRPLLPKDIQALIRQMATENPTWGQEHIANELKLKLGIRVSPRTVGKYLREWPRRQPDPSQRWQPSFAITPRRWWPATSSSWSQPDSVSFMCSFSWNRASAPIIPARSGP